MTDPVLVDLERAADKEKAAFFPRFFKTGKGQYGEGDVFIGVTVPKMRLVAKKHRDIPLSHIKKLLSSPIHEARLCALLILVAQYQRGDEKKRQAIVDFYLMNFKNVNNWDLVDSSAPHILGRHLLETKRSTAILDRFATSKHLWTQRISIVATQAFIRAGELEHTFRISEILLHHDHDLIHKAVGWMLREAGKKNRTALEKFLKKHAPAMPRTMLRYAIEKFDEPARKRYLKA